MEPVSGKHSINTHCSKDPNSDICLKTEIVRPSCRRRAGTVVPRAENFGDLITADHKVLSEESESRNNHRCAVVVQNLATYWIQSYPCKTKTSQETQKSSMKFLEPTRNQRSCTLTIPWTLAGLASNYPGIIVRRGESGKETSWSQTLKNWSRWTHQHSTPEGSMQRKC